VAETPDEQGLTAPEDAAPATQPRRRRWWRRLLRAFVFAAGLLLAVIGVAILSTQTPWFKDWLRRYIARQATAVLNGELAIGRLRGNLVGGVELDGVTLSQHGEKVIAIDRVRVDYSILAIISRGIILDELDLQHPVVVARQTPTGWNVAQLVRAQTRKPGGRGPSIAITRIRLSDGQVLVHRLPPAALAGAAASTPRPPARVDDVDGELGLASIPGSIALDVTHVSFTMADPALRVGHLSGRFVRRPDALAFERLRVDLPASNITVDGGITGIGSGARADLSLTSTSLAFREIGLFVPALAPIPLQPAISARLRGPVDALETELHLRSSAGRADGRVLVDFGEGRRRFAGTMDLVGINPAPWAMSPAFDGSATGRATFDLSLADAAQHRPFRGTFHFTGPDARAAGYGGRDVDVRGRLDGPRLTIAQGRALAYGARVTVAGVIEPVPGAAPGARYDLRGHASGVDLRRLPPSLPIPDLDTRVDAQYTVKGSGRDFEGAATLGDSIVEGARLASGTTGYFALKNRAIRYGATGRIADLNLPRLGTALDVRALGDPRFDGAITGAFSVDASGRSIRDLELSAKGELEKSTLLGAEFPHMTVGATISGGRLDADVKGDFASLEPEFVSGVARLEGVANGQIEGRATIADLARDITIDAVSFDGRVDLTSSRIADIELTSAKVNGRFAGRSGRITSAAITSPLADLTLSGDFALGDEGQSALTYTVTRSDLAAISKQFDQSLAGTASMSGRITGNGRELVTTGTGRVEKAAAAESVTAESLDLDYTVRIPDLDFARAAVDTQVAGKGLVVAGQQIATLDGKVGYAARSVVFDVRAADRTRTVDAAGRADLLEGRQHVVLSKLAARVETLTWRLREGAEAAIDYDGEAVTVDGLTLTHDAAAVDANGTIAVGPRAESRLELSVAGLQIADVNRLLQRPAGEYSGVLNGLVTIGGTRAQPEVLTRFKLTNGVVRELTFAELGGDVTYDGRFFGIDVTLVQQPGTTLAARGQVPLSLIREESTHASDPIDLHVTSSTIGLEVASGLTKQLSDLAGSAKIDLHVRGTADTPLFQGGVTLTGGAFTVVPTGRHYSDLTSNLRFEPGRLVIDSLGTLDENKDALEVTGELGLRRTTLGAVSLQVKAREFGVLRNDFGSADIDADLKISGELTALKVEGELAFHTGRIEIDRVLDRLTGGAYATEPLDDVPIPGEGQRPDEPATVGRITTASGQTRTLRNRRAAAAAADQPAAGAQPTPPDVGEKAAAGFFSKATLNVRVRIPDNLVLRGRDIRTSSSSLGLGNINLTVGGDFRVRKDPGTPTALVGSVNTVRGTYDFRGRRFDILRDGRIQFQGTTPVDPTLDVTAQRVIEPSGVEARIRVQGTASNPTLSFSSDPPLDEADILALIVFNRPLNSLGSGERTSLVDLAGATAAGFVVSPLTESVGRALNLDLFEVQATSESGGPGGLLTIGQQVGDQLYFKFRQQFGAQEVSEFVLEYQLSSFLRLQASAADGDGVGRANRSLTRRIERAGLDLIFYFSY
jgi:TamB, inner membrane protein subunit of TAM complex